MSSAERGGQEGNGVSQMSGKEWPQQPGHGEDIDLWGQQFEALGGREGENLASRKSVLPVIKKGGNPGSVPGLDG